MNKIKQGFRSAITYFTWPEILIIITIIMLLLSIAIPVFVKARRTAANPQATYLLWVKYTGNPRHITFEEFKELKRRGLLGEERK